MDQKFYEFYFFRIEPLSDKKEKKIADLLKFIIGTSIFNISGFLGESLRYDCGCTIVQKSHGKHVAYFKGRAIIIIRNPYDVLITYFHFKHGGGHKGHAPQHMFKSKGKLQRQHESVRQMEQNYFGTLIIFLLFFTILQIWILFCTN